MIKVLLVTGTRRETRRGVVRAYLERERPDLLIVGCCPTGVDREAAVWFLAKGMAPLIGTAPWGKCGPRGGPIRNKAMADMGGMLYRCSPPEYCDVRWVAVPDEDSIGTHGMIKLVRGWDMPGEVL